MADPVKALRELLNNPEWRFASGIPQDAEIDENALNELEKWANEPIVPPDLPVMYGPFFTFPNDDSTRN